MEERDWEVARRKGQRIFYEKATETMRTCPENYLVAVVAAKEYGGERKWCATPDAAIQKPSKDEIQKVLDYMKGNPPWCVAEYLAKDIPWPRREGA